MTAQTCYSLNASQSLQRVGEAFEVAPTSQETEKLSEWAALKLVVVKRNDTEA